jgi:hypothetical protein
MANEKMIKIGSLRELQLQMPRIVPKINADPALALAAATNPLLALEHLGYDLSAQARKEIEPYARFGPDGLKKLADIEQRWVAAYGSQQALPFDRKGTRTAIEYLLATTVAKAPTADKKAAPAPKVTTAIDSALDLLFFKQKPDAAQEKVALERLTALHPALPVLYEYQRLLVARPPFASKETFEKIRTGKAQSAANSITFRLKTSEERKQTRLEKK